jgi:hypothetical protein
VRRSAHDRAVERLLARDVPVGPIAEALIEALLEAPQGHYVLSDEVSAMLGMDLNNKALFRAVKKLRSAGWTIVGRNGCNGGGYRIG